MMQISPNELGVCVWMRFCPAGDAILVLINQTVCLIAVMR